MTQTMIGRAAPATEGTLSRLSNFMANRGFVLAFGIILPVAVYIVFVGWPILFNVYLSFTKWNGLAPDVIFVGFDNYVRLFGDPGFRGAFLNSLKWALLALSIHLFIGLTLSIVLHSGRVYFPAFFRSLIFLPFTMSLVTVGLMFSLILSPGFGVLDALLRGVGLEGLIRTWLGDYDVTIFVLIIIDAWAYLGIPLMMFHAGLSAINTELFDAARVDGAKRVATGLARHAAEPQAGHPHRDHAVDHPVAQDLRPGLGHDRRRSRRRHLGPWSLHVRHQLPSQRFRLRRYHRRGHALVQRRLRFDLSPGSCPQCSGLIAFAACSSDVLSRRLWSPRSRYCGSSRRF